MHCAHSQDKASPQSRGTGLLRQPRAHHSSRSSRLDQTPAYPRKQQGTDSRRGTRSGLGSLWIQRPPAPWPAAPSSILFIPQQGDLARESKLSLFLVHLSCRPSSSSFPSSERLSSLGEAATRKSQLERSQSRGLTKRGHRTRAKADPLQASPGLGSLAGGLPASSGVPR